MNPGKPRPELNLPRSKDPATFSVNATMKQYLVLFSYFLLTGNRFALALTGAAVGTGTLTTNR